jgi:hypothetical protein
MKKADAFPSRFWKAEDVKDQSAVVTIAYMTTDQIGPDKQEKYILYFQDSKKQLVLNATNWDTIVDITGETDSDMWSGHCIKLVHARVDFGGKKVDAVRVRAANEPTKQSARQPARQEPPPPSSPDEYGAKLKD